jgi:UDP-2,4-diacetamido-2,4,6-trideoxy-beta-L-altropyranose hydrolase
MSLRGRRVLFAVAAGPRIGFGHVGRSRALARALDVRHVVALRGTPATARAVRDLGASVCARTGPALERFKPALVVIDDPSVRHGRAALHQARRAGVPVASVHDLGYAHLHSDLVIDATPIGRRGEPLADLVGPAFTVLDPSLRDLRRPRHTRRTDRILIALGGGSHILRYGAALAVAIGAAWPTADIVLAPGFSPGPRPELPAGAEWLDRPGQLQAELSRCTAAIVGGGLTLAEACVLGTPTVALAVTRAQRPHIIRLAEAGAVLDAGLAMRPGAMRRVAAGLMALRSDAQARQLGRRAQSLIDGRGASRVAAALAALFERTEGHRHAA